MTDLNRLDIRAKTYSLIDELKAVCHNFGLGNDGNEYKVISQVFLYKFLNDKFGYELKKLSSQIANAEKWEETYSKLSDEKRLDLCDMLSADIMKFQPNELLSLLWNQQSKGEFEVIFDDTMKSVADNNLDIFSTQTSKNSKIPIFEKLTNYITDESQRAPFARALVDKLAKFSFEGIFSQGYDFFADIFEYMIKDYNTNGGGVYAEYYTPHSIAVIMAKLLVGTNESLHSIECYDPAAGTGTLLMALAHQIGEDKCTIFAQDRSQKSNKLLKLNLILNGLVASLDHAIQGDTLTDPYHMSDDNKNYRQFDYVVCNPPFKLDFSEQRESLAAQKSRFWAGVSKVPNKKKDSMEIYLCFLQHFLNSIKSDGKGAIVVPTGFLTAQSGIPLKIRKHLVDNKFLKGVVSMPSNIFANTGTNVSVVFIDKSGIEKTIFIDASKLGEETKEGKNKKTVLSSDDVNKIVETFTNTAEVDEFSVTPSIEDIKSKNYSFSAGQYFEVKIDHIDITEEEFSNRIDEYTSSLETLFEEGKILENNIKIALGNLKYDK